MKKGDLVRLLNGVMGPTNWKPTPKGTLGIVLEPFSSVDHRFITVYFPDGIRDIQECSLEVAAPACKSSQNVV
jgi:hypothetical protein